MLSPAPTSPDNQLTYTFDDRHWRVRGLEKQLSCERLRVNLLGEETNKLVCYLACVSRLLPRPLSVLIQSSSAAGKTSLLEGTLQLMPPEAQLRWSALTSQSLYYLGRDELKHKILAVAEEEGVREASYALKLLQSKGRLSLAMRREIDVKSRPAKQWRGKPALHVKNEVYLPATSRPFRVPLLHPSVFPRVTRRPGWSSDQREPSLWSSAAGSTTPPPHDPSSSQSWTVRHGQQVGHSSTAPLFRVVRPFTFRRIDPCASSSVNRCPAMRVIPRDAPPSWTVICCGWRRITMLPAR